LRANHTDGILSLAVLKNKSPSTTLAVRPRAILGLVTLCCNYTFSVELDLCEWPLMAVNHKRLHRECAESSISTKVGLCSYSCLAAQLFCSQAKTIS
jgi:hypothetical protein